MDTTNSFSIEDPSITYRDAHLSCDRNGVPSMLTHIPDFMPPIAQAPWLKLSLAATALALQSSDGTKWIVPNAAEAGEDTEAAMDDIWSFRKRPLAALLRPIRTRRNAP